MDSYCNSTNSDLSRLSVRTMVHVMVHVRAAGVVPTRTLHATASRREATSTFTATSSFLRRTYDLKTFLTRLSHLLAIFHVVS